MPSAGSFNRTILAYKIGGQTQITSIVSSIIILFTILFLTPVIYYLPQSVISAIIIYSVYFLFDLELIFKLWKEDKIELSYVFITMLLTFALWFSRGYFFRNSNKIFRRFFFKKKSQFVLKEYTPESLSFP